MTTNYERIKSMSVDEMAEFFVKNRISCIDLFRMKNNKIEPCPIEGTNCTAFGCFKQWLKSEE